MYITNDEKIAEIVENSDVDWIFIDLEINGKEKRQGHLDTVISRHKIDDIKKVKKVLTKSELLVRVNPIYEESKQEINRVIEDGADIIMLPFFKKKEEVEFFIDRVNRRSKICLLLETPEAVENINSILEVDGIDYIHIGLNDLHIGYKKRFMFELLADGTVDMLCNTIKEKGIVYGFGGIAGLGQGTLPAKSILAEHYRLGSSMAILSRSFCNANQRNDIARVAEVFQNGVREIRTYENELFHKERSFFEENKKQVQTLVESIVRNIMKE
jgi:hypothetical protein